ncbi:hypothetical protein C8Q75DRAFT_784887 [Abortiporus biennis]|nr:hypothetical protein C8Q75DRAFT_784887 [Abortiporus biennis]
MLWKRWECHVKPASIMPPTCVPKSTSLCKGTSTRSRDRKYLCGKCDKMVKSLSHHDIQAHSTSFVVKLNNGEEIEIAKKADGYFHCPNCISERAPNPLGLRRHIKTCYYNNDSDDDDIDIPKNWNSWQAQYADDRTKKSSNNIKKKSNIPYPGAKPSPRHLIKGNTATPSTQHNNPNATSSTNHPKPAQPITGHSNASALSPHSQTQSKSCSTQTPSSTTDPRRRSSLPKFKKNLPNVASETTNTTSQFNPPETKASIQNSSSIDSPTSHSPIIESKNPHPQSKSSTNQLIFQNPNPFETDSKIASAKSSILPSTSTSTLTSPAPNPTSKINSLYNFLNMLRHPLGDRMDVFVSLGFCTMEDVEILRDMDEESLTLVQVKFEKIGLLYRHWLIFGEGLKKYYGKC